MIYQRGITDMTLSSCYIKITMDTSWETLEITICYPNKKQNCLTLKCTYEDIFWWKNN